MSMEEFRHAAARHEYALSLAEFHKTRVDAFREAGRGDLAKEDQAKADAFNIEANDWMERMNVLLCGEPFMPLRFYSEE